MFNETSLVFSFFTTTKLRINDNTLKASTLTSNTAKECITFRSN